MSLIQPCPKCGHCSNKASQTRWNKGDGTLVRRRYCFHCKHRWTTKEVTADRLHLLELKAEQLEKLLSVINDGVGKIMAMEPKKRAKGKGRKQRAEPEEQPRPGEGKSKGVRVSRTKAD